MKKLLLHALLIVGSALILGTGANAQSSRHYRVEIPFDFQAGGVQYTAGEYVLGPLGQVDKTTLTIRNAETGKTRYLGQTKPIGDGRQGKGKMVFLKSDGLYTLSEIVTSDFGLTFRIPRANNGVGTILASKVETVAVNLN